MKAEINPTLCCGSDLDIANAARRSFDANHLHFTNDDAGLVRFLLREKHMLPFRHPQLSFSCEAPIFVARQLGKHQVGMSWSEISRRYKTSRMRFWRAEQWREKPVNAKQGTGGPVSRMKNAALRFMLAVVEELAYTVYRLMLWLGATPEQARSVLPQSMYVYWTWTGSLLAWMHLIKERQHPNAQTETRVWVDSFIAPAIAERFPVTWGAMQDSADGSTDR